MPTNIDPRADINHWRSQHLAPRIQLLPATYAITRKGLLKTTSLGAKKTQVQARKHRNNRSGKNDDSTGIHKACQANGR
jgi:hypothetical protein